MRKGWRSEPKLIQLKTKNELTLQVPVKSRESLENFYKNLEILE